MAVDKLVDSTLLDAACTYEAGKIREKLGSSAQIAYDLANGKGFGDAIAAITGGPVYEDSGSLTLTSDYIYTSAAYSNYTGSILISTSLSKILAVEGWMESWNDQTATRPCFGCFYWLDPSLGIAKVYSITSSPYYYGPGNGIYASATDWFVRTVNVGPILHCMTTSVDEGKFGIKTHNNTTDYALRTGDVFHWKALGTKT